MYADKYMQIYCTDHTHTDHIIMHAYVHIYAKESSLTLKPGIDISFNKACLP